MSDMQLSSRREYLLNQKKIHGRYLFGVFPAQYPREILWAMNILPVEIWDPPLDTSHAGAHLQTYICTIAKLGLELILQGKTDILDGFLFPHTCDSIQNLSSIVNDYLGTGKPCFFFYHPKGVYRESSHRFYIEQLRGFVSQLENHVGTLDYSQLRQSIDKSESVASLMRQLYRVRAYGELGVSNVDFYRTIRQSEFLHPDDFIPLLEGLLEERRNSPRSEPSVILSGVLPNPLEMLALLDELKIRVGDDDLLACGRRHLVPSSQCEDPFEILADRYFHMPPCTTRNAPVTERLEYLINKAEGSKAQGVLFCMVKFCEPELFDLPYLTEELKKRGLRTLVLDIEPNQGLTGQLITRIEAFGEMIAHH
ncbi:MAG: 2-hydroxyacyl-CoA dehydratase subunit D [Thermodesulfobacteriota bacterium]